MDEVVDILTEKDFSKNLKVPKWLTLKNTVSNTQPSSKNQMVRHFTSHVTWLLPSTVNVLYDFAKAIYVVGNEQSAHFKQLKAVLKEMGYDWSDDMTHVAFGLVTKNGKKLSTRKGNVILLEPTIAEAVNRAQAQIEAKNPNLPNKEAVAHAVGVGAIKFPRS